ncbi:3'-5' exonuclease [Myxococcota bacterium]|nr:3'-5' exonuclease [Myxococcota bacterium]
MALLTARNRRIPGVSRREPLPGPTNLPVPPEPPDSTPWRQVPFLALDLETGGLDPVSDPILSVGTVPIDGGRIRLSEAWTSLVAPPPERPVTAGSIRIHHLLPDRLRSAPPLRQVLALLLPRLEGRVLVVHVRAVDQEFLQHAFQRIFGVPFRWPIVDTARLASFFAEQPLLGSDAGPLRSLRLPDVAGALGIPVDRHHEALGDALLCGEVLLGLASRLERMGRGTLGDLLRAGA